MTSSADPVNDTSDFRRWLARRIDAESHDFWEADPEGKEMCWSRLLACLELGVRLGFWSERTSERASNSIYDGRRGGVSWLLLRG